MGWKSEQRLTRAGASQLQPSFISTVVGTSENSVKAKFAEFTYHEDKRCMLAFLKLVADFSSGCAHPAMRPPIPATHPYPVTRKTGAPLPGLRPEEGHTPLYRGRPFSLG
jgi:hypothetical protein